MKNKYNFISCRLIIFLFLLPAIGLLILSVAIAEPWQNFPTTVQRCTDGCTIHINIQIGVNGGTDADLQNIKSDIEDCFRGLRCGIPCVNPPDSCMITVQVEVQKWGNLSDEDKKKFHQVLITNSSSPSMAWEEQPNTTTGTAHPVGAWLRKKDSGAYNREYCHEIGHLSGLKDGYCGYHTPGSMTFSEPTCKTPPGPPPPDPCCTPSGTITRCTTPCNDVGPALMSDLSKPTCADILKIVAAAGPQVNSCPESPCCPLPPPPPGPTVTPIGPQPGLTGSSTTVTFNWTDLPHVATYELEIYKGIPPQQSPIFGGLTGPSSTFIGPLPLDYNTVYSWRVRAYFEKWYKDYISPWSEFSWFETMKKPQYVNADHALGSDGNDGLVPYPEGDGHGPKLTIQAAINDEINGPTNIINVAQGEYSGFQIPGPVTIIGEGEVLVFGMSPVVISNSPLPSQLINLNFMINDILAVINGTGNIIATDCKYYLNGILINECLALQPLILDGRAGLGPGKFYFNHPPCAPYYNALAYWLDPTGIPQLSGSYLQNWPDNSMIPEDAQILEDKRMPTYQHLGINNFPSVLFLMDYGVTKYGFSDIMESSYNPEITSDIDDKWEPQPIDKSLFIVFKTGQNVNQIYSAYPYYSDGRQTIYEAGGPLSGFNMYISNGKLCFGMWNRFEKKYLLYDPQGSDNPFYPLNPNEVYLSNLEYNSISKSFKVSISNKNIAESSPTVTFKGITKDDEDKTGIGGAARTSYHDYNTGETYSGHFGGMLGDIMLYNNLGKNNQSSEAIFTFLNDRYNQGWIPPLPKKGDDKWKIIETSNFDFEYIALSSAYPNPCAKQTSFGLWLPEKQNVIIELFDAYANRVSIIYSGTLLSGMHDFNIDASNLSNGMYIYRAMGDGFTKSGKVIVNK